MALVIGSFVESDVGEGLRELLFASWSGPSDVM
jgi:hypothetical protein